jgi:hypothetical protein
MVDFDDVSVYPHARRRRRKKKGEKKKHIPKSEQTSNVQSTSFQHKENAKNRFLLDTTPAHHHQFVEHFQVLPFVGLAYQGNDIDSV